MDRNTPPYSWEGQTIEVLLITQGGMKPNFERVYFRTAEQNGTLDQVSAEGILGTFIEDEGDQPTQKFYPWSAILSIEPKQ